MIWEDDMNRRKWFLLLPLLIVVMILWPSEKAKAEMQPGWNKIDGKYYYCTEYGFVYSDGFYDIGSHRYYFDKNGVMQTGWIKDTVTDEQDGTVYTYWYHAAAGGAIDIGWKKIGDKWYYFDDYTGLMYTGWWYEDDKTYYLGDDGAMKTGWIKETYCYPTSGGSTATDVTWYYASSSGALVSGWQKINNKWYYMDPDTNYMYAGDLYCINDEWYFFTAGGALAGAGWQSTAHTVDGKKTWYYTKSDGTPEEGWKKIGGYWYYLYPEMVSDELVYLDGKYEYFASNGIWKPMNAATGFQRSGSNVKYKKADGTFAKGWQKVGAHYYYFDASGNMKEGWVKDNGKWYYLYPEMAANTVIYPEEEGGKMYFVNANGVMVTGGWAKETYTYNSAKYVTWYYADTSGALISGWKKINNKWYYFDDEFCFMYSDGWHQIGNTYYEFNMDGSWTGHSEPYI